MDIAIGILGCLGLAYIGRGFIRGVFGKRK